MRATRATEAMNNASKVFLATQQLRGFIGRRQLQFAVELSRGEEGEFYVGKLSELAETVRTMPKTYDQNGKGDAAVAHLHYFIGRCDWWITERDAGDGAADEVEQFQSQAFGLASFGDGSEMGYISLPEILAAGAELDFHFRPQTVGELRKRHG